MMRGLTLAALLLALAHPALAAPERRCGWLHNPSPGNWWLTDRDGDWILSTQGRDSVPGMEKLPEFGPNDWVRTNGSYGHGCACMVLERGARVGDVRRLVSTDILPLSRCRGDRSLPRP